MYEVQKGLLGLLLLLVVVFLLAAIGSLGPSLGL
jgi:hypothetical protein